MALAVALFTLVLICSATFAITTPFTRWSENRTTASFNRFFLILISSLAAAAFGHRGLGLGLGSALGVPCMVLPQVLLIIRHKRQVALIGRGDRRVDERHVHPN